jgi:hypothetical protein
VTTSPVLAAVHAALVDHFGATPQRASLSFVGVDPIDVLRFEPVPGERAYLSLGMARQPMTGAAQAVLPADGPRAELMLRLRDPLDQHADVWRRVALLAAAPTVEGVVYAPGMSVDLGAPLVPGSACTGVLVTESALPPIDTPAGAVAVYAVVPATAGELAWCRVRGATALRERWASQGSDLLDLLRRPVALD